MLGICLLQYNLIFPTSACRFLSVGNQISQLVFVTARKRSLRRLCFNRCLSVHRGGVHGFIRGHAWFYLGGHAWFYSGACVVLFGGRAWFYLGGMHGFILGGLHGFIWGVCVVLFGGGACVVYLGACVVLFGGHVWFYSGGMRGTRPTGMHSCYRLITRGSSRNARGSHSLLTRVVLILITLASDCCSGLFKGPVTPAIYSTTTITWTIFVKHFLHCNRNSWINYKCECPPLCAVRPIVTARKRSFGQGNIFSSVCPQGWGSAPGGRECLLPGGGVETPLRRLLLWAVRILLECILVL